MEWVCGTAPATLLEVESKVTLTFSLVGHEPSITAKGSVAWIRPDGSAGVQFTRPQRKARKLIVHWMQRSPEAPLPSCGEPMQQAVGFQIAWLVSLRAYFTNVRGETTGCSALQPEFLSRLPFKRRIDDEGRRPSQSFRFPAEQAFQVPVSYPESSVLCQDCRSRSQE